MKKYTTKKYTMKYVAIKAKQLKTEYLKSEDGYFFLIYGGMFNEEIRKILYLSKNPQGVIAWSNYYFIDIEQLYDVIEYSERITEKQMNIEINKLKMMKELMK